MEGSSWILEWESTLLLISNCTYIVGSLNSFGLQEWISMNYWTSLKEIAGSITMMLLLWSYHLKEEFGSHQESTFDDIIHKQAMFSIQAILQFRISARDSLQAVWKALLLTVVHGGPLGFVFCLTA